MIVRPFDSFQRQLGVLQPTRPYLPPSRTTMAAPIDFANLDDDQFGEVMRLPYWDEWAAKQRLQAEGLPVTLRAEWLGPLFALRVEPGPGFQHLVRPECVEESLRRQGPYHISICFEWDVRPETAHHVHEVVQRWDGWQGVLAAEYVSPGEGKGYFELSAAGPFRTCPHITTLHRGGSYSYKELHVSM